MKAREYRNDKNADFTHRAYDHFYAGAMVVREALYKKDHPDLTAANAMVFSSAGAYRNHMNGGAR